MPVAQSTFKSQSGAGNTTNAITTQTSGSIFVVGCAAQSGTISLTLTDSKSNSYGSPILELGSGSGADGKIWYKENGVGGSGHTWSNSSAADGTLYAVELTGMLTSGSLDQTASNTDSSNPFDSTAIITTQATETIIAMAVSGSGDYSAGNGFTILQKEPDSGLYWPSALAAREVTSAGSYSAQFTDASAGQTALLIVSFKAQTAASGASVSWVRG